MPDYTYTVNIEPLEEGGFMVSVPALPGCFSYGKTYEEAVSMAREAIEGYIESLVKLGKEVPREPGPISPIAIGVQVPSHAA